MIDVIVFAAVGILAGFCLVSGSPAPIFAPGLKNPNTGF